MSPNLAVRATCMRCFLAFIAALIFANGAAQSAMPTGPTPVPVDLPHFPDTFHAFVFRNWNLVPVDRLAKAANTKPPIIRNQVPVSKYKRMEGVGEMRQ